MRFTQARLTNVDNGACEMSFVASRWLLNAYGVMYGGALALMADLAIGGATWPLLPRATSFAPLDLAINFIRAVPGGDSELHARAAVTHSGRTIAVVSSQIVDARDRLVGTAVETMLMLPGRPSDRPVNVGDEVPMETGRTA